MDVGLIGAGNMARALARGWGEPVLVSDVVLERAQRAGGRARGRGASTPTPRWPSAPTCSCSATSRPARGRWPQRSTAAPRRSRRSSAARRSSRPAAAYPGIPVFRFMPNVAVEVRTGGPRLRRAGARRRGRGAASRRSSSCSAAWAAWSRCRESLIDVAMALMSTRAGHVRADRRGADRRRHPPRACRTTPRRALVADAMAGTAALLEARDHDTLALRRVGDVAGRGHRAWRWPRSTGRACGPRCTTRWTRSSRRACDDARWR